MIWDELTGAAVDAPKAAAIKAGEVKPALSGTFTVDGVKCRTAFDHLVDGCKGYTPEYTGKICGIDPAVVERLAEEYIMAKPAAIRMGQGMQRVNHSYSPFRTVATLAMVAGYIGVKGGGASHAGGTATNKPVAGYTGPVYNYTDWSNTGKKANMVPSSQLYNAAVDRNPVGIDFLWIANSNLINMSPDSNYMINHVLPAIDFIVTADPWWTWTAKYSDIVLPATSYWEHWDLIDRSPWAMFNQPAIEPLGESKSDVEMMTMLAKKCGVEQYWDKAFTAAPMPSTSRPSFTPTARATRPTPASSSSTRKRCCRLAKRFPRGCPRRKTRAKASWPRSIRLRTSSTTTV